MTDMLLDRSGDLALTEDGDVTLTASAGQAIAIRLRWIRGEWRLGPGYGFPWLEELLVKGPNLTRLRGLLRQEILSVEGVSGADVPHVRYDPAARRASFPFTAYLDGEHYSEEVTLRV